MAADIVAVIPARYGSTRLPGKALAKSAGADGRAGVAADAPGALARRVIVATDDERIAARGARGRRRSR